MCESSAGNFVYYDALLPKRRLVMLL